MTKIRINVDIEIDRDTMEHIVNRFKIGSTSTTRDADAYLVTKHVQDVFALKYLSTKEEELEKVIYELANQPSFSEYDTNQYDVVERLLAKRKTLIFQIDSYKLELEKENIKEKQVQKSMDDDLPF